MKNHEVEQEHLEMQESLNKFLLENGRPIEDYKFVAIGYLDTDEEFEKGEVSTNFLTKLKVLWNEGGPQGLWAFTNVLFVKGDLEQEKEQQAVQKKH